jgi:DNA-binding CsgD family transcriptional regulator
LPALVHENRRFMPPAQVSTMRGDPFSVRMKSLGAGRVMIVLAPVAERKSALAEVLAMRFGLNRRECDVVVHLRSGLRNKEIAQITHLASKTVSGYLGSAFEKLGVRSRVELVATIDQLTSGVL